MGAHAFHATSKETDHRKAYERLVDDALMMSGHDSYNGTISTTSGYRVVATKPVSQAAADKIADTRILELDKWGVCEAIPVGRSPKTTTRNVVATFTPTSTDGITITIDMVADAAVVNADRIEGFEVLESKPVHTFTKRPAGEKKKVWTTSAGGTYPTKAAAYAAAKKYLQERGQNYGSTIPGNETLEVTQKTISAPEAGLTRTLTGWKVKLRVTIAKSDEREFDHWLFYGWAAS